MIQNIDAIYDHGVFRPKVPVNLPEGTEVSIPVPLAPSLMPVHNDARARFLSLLGSVDCGTPLGTNNDEIDRDLARQYGAGN